MRAATYRRISEDSEGLELGVQRQAEDLREYITRRGYELFDDYVDNDISASTRTRRVRPAFQRLLADARAGKFQIVVAYTSSRLTRKPRENEDLIELAERHGIRFEYIRSPSFDLNTADGRQIARMLAASDAAEAERAAERKSRQRRQEAEQGRARGGHRPFGWRAPQGPLDPTEAKLLRDAAKEMLAGGYTTRIVERWNEAGVLTASGKQWSRRSLQKCLTAPRIAGYAVFQGELLKDKNGDPVKGQWPAILDEQTWLALCARFENAERQQPMRTYLLSGVVRCSGCSMPMRGGKREAGYHSYRCIRGEGGCGKRTITGPPLDALIEKLVLKKLHGRKAELPATEWAGEAALTAAEESKAEIWAAYKAKVLPGSEAFPQIAELEAEVKRLEREKAAATRTQLRPSGALAMWESGDVLQRREVVKRLWSAILIHPSTDRGAQRRFDVARVEPVPR